MDIFLSILAFILSIVGIIGCIVPMLPGPALNFIALLMAYSCSYSQITTSTLLIWLVITILVSLADYFLPVYMTKKFGGSRSGTIGATIGLVGGLFFLPVGILIGPFMGAVLGELLNDKKDSAKAFRVGLGSFVAFFIGTGAQLIASVGMFVYLWTDTYPVIKGWAIALFS